MRSAVVVRHNFETAHRLPFLGGKCTNLHGHSWWAQVTVRGEVDDNGILLDFGQLKRDLRDWVDAELDHGTMLGVEDPLVGPLLREGCKVFLFDPDTGRMTGDGNGTVRGLAWPTVENVAELLRRVTVDYLRRTTTSPFDVEVTVTETAVNAAIAFGALG